MALVGWWPLDGNTNDYSVNNNTGVNNNVTFVNGKIGQAGSFNGTSSFVNVSGSYVTSLITSTVNKHFSISVWIKPTNIGTDQAIVSQRHGDAMSLFLLSNGKVTFEMDDTQNYQGTNTVLQNNNWYNIVVTFFNSGSSSYVRYYVNGTFEKQETKWDGNGISANSNLWIGWQSRTDYGRNPGFFNGQINDVRLYDYILSQKEINELAKAKVLHYAFNKDESIVYDGSGYKRNATKVGTPTASVDTKLGSNSLLVGLGNNGIGYPSTHNLNIRDAITLNVWLKRTTAFNQLQDMFLISRPPSWYFYDAYNSGNIQGEVFIDGVRRGARNTALPFDGNWYMITYTYNSANQKSSIYKNGVLQSETTLTGLSNYLIDASANNFQTGGSFTLGTRGMLMDDIRIYSTALTATDIFDMYQTRAKIDNQGNLYANEFVEDYEVAPGLTLTQLFDTLNTDANFSEGTSGWTAHGSSTYSVSNGNMFVTANGTQVYGWLYKNGSAANGRTYYINLRARVTNPDALNISYWVSGFQVIQANPVQNQWYSFSNVYTHGASGAFTLLEHRYADTATSSGKVMEVDFYYFYDITDKITTLGYTPTKAQLDTWFRDYTQSRTKSNGQIITNEFSEVDSPSQEMKIFKDKIQIQGSLNEGGQ